MLRGTTRIELKDVKTGAVTETEDHNVVTDALNRMLKPYGVFNNSIFNTTESKKLPFWKVLLGGILLFEDEIPYLMQEGQNGGYTETCWPPADVKMVANGSTLFNRVNQNPKEIGIFNENESGIQPDGSIKFVYDWDTSHGNGTIGCVCLTSCVGGYEGYGNRGGSVETEVSSITDSNYINYISSPAPRNILMDIKTFAILKTDMDAETAYIIDGREFTPGDSHFKKTGKLHVYKVKIEIGRLILASGIESLPYELHKTINIPEESLSEYRDNYPYRACTDSKTGRTYISTHVGGNTLVLDSDFNLTEKKLGITSTIDLAYNNCLYYYKNNQLEVMNAETLEIVKRFEANSITDIRGVLKEGIIQGFGKADAGANITSEVLINTETFDCVQTNKKIVHKQKLWIDNGMYFLDKLYGGREEQKNLVLLKDGRYLATINNLSSPVTKTTEKTMKITYTIREE